MESFEIRLTERSSIADLASHAADRCQRLKIDPVETDRIVGEVRRVLSDLHEQGKQLVDMGCSFSTTRKIQSGQCSIILTADYATHRCELLDGCRRLVNRLLGR